MDKYEIARKLRGAAVEFGQLDTSNIVIVGPDDLPATVCGHQYVRVQTIAETTLGNAPYKLARFFEDFPEEKPHPQEPTP